jgi:hypothetical protein
MVLTIKCFICSSKNIPSSSQSSCLSLQPKLNCWYVLVHNVIMRADGSVVEEAQFFALEVLTIST